MANQSRREFLQVTGLGAAVALAANLVKRAEAQARRPSILFILIDDMGWMDSGVYGSQYYDTPNIDALAQRSMRFTDAYSANPLCSPTRASIMTGLYPCRLGITTPAGHLPPLPEDFEYLPDEAAPWERTVKPESRRLLPLEEVTIAEVLREAGYATGFIGKWHLGQTEEFWPHHQGFDVNIAGGGYPGPPSYFSPYHIEPLPDGPEGEYIADRLTDEAISFLGEHRDEPFFLCLWHYSIHAPYQAKDEYIAEHADRVDPRGEQDNPVMAAMIRSMDESIGRVLGALDDLGLTDDTIIIFTSDNGGNEYDRVGEAQWTPTNNAPLRSGKGSIFEGGVRVPLMVSWPGRIEPESLCDVPVMSIDFFPTLLKVAGLPVPPERILDGADLMPLLTGGGEWRRDAIFCHMPHRVGSVTGPLSEAATWVRQGDWKLIRFYDNSPEFPNAWELYNLRDDIGETHNLAPEMPDRVRAMDALIDRHLMETAALVPRPNHAWSPAARREIAGWTGSGHVALLDVPHVLRLDSRGGDPFVMTSDVPAVEGDLVARFRMRSTSQGPGQFFWADVGRNFGPAVRLDFTPVHDGEWHDYAVPFTPNGAIHRIRIDPSAAPGAIEFDWVRIESADGRVHREWDFER